MRALNKKREYITKTGHDLHPTIHFPFNITHSYSSCFGAVFSVTHYGLEVTLLMFATTSLLTTALYPCSRLLATSTELTAWFSADTAQNETHLSCSFPQTVSAELHNHNFMLANSFSKLLAGSWETLVFIVPVPSRRVDRVRWFSKELSTQTLQPLLVHATLLPPQICSSRVVCPGVSTPSSLWDVSGSCRLSLTRMTTFDFPRIVAA